MGRRSFVRRSHVNAADAATVIATLRARANLGNVEGMARFGISRVGTLGVPVKELRRLAKEAGRSHKLAAGLWRSGIHEARVMASLVEEVESVTPRQMDLWVRAVDSWDVCDQLCQNLFRYTSCGFEKAAEWARAEPEFVRRAGFALMAGPCAQRADGAGRAVRGLPAAHRRGRHGRAEHGEEGRQLGPAPDR